MTVVNENKDGNENENGSKKGDEKGGGRTERLRRLYREKSLFLNHEYAKNKRVLKIVAFFLAYMQFFL